MTLLLGPPGCGKTSLLKALSGNQKNSLKVTFFYDVLLNKWNFSFQFPTDMIDRLPILNQEKKLILSSFISFNGLKVFRFRKRSNHFCCFPFQILFNRSQGRFLTMDTN